MTADTTVDPPQVPTGSSGFPTLPQSPSAGLGPSWLPVVSSSRHRKTEMYTQPRRNSNPTRSECLQLPSMCLQVLPASSALWTDVCQGEEGHGQSRPPGETAHGVRLGRWWYSLTLACLGHWFKAQSPQNTSDPTQQRPTHGVSTGTVGGSQEWFPTGQGPEWAWRESDLSPSPGHPWEQGSMFFYGLFHKTFHTPPQFSTGLGLPCPQGLFLSLPPAQGERSGHPFSRAPGSQAG